MQNNALCIGLFEFLMNREGNLPKEIVELKYEILKAIHDQPEAASVIPKHILDQVAAYVKQGPFYATSEARVAIDEM